MATFEKFEDIEAWRKSRELFIETHSIIIRKESKKDQSLVWQIMKSTGSIMDNIAEGFERGGNKEFIQFLAIAKGSAAELKSQLYRALDQKMITEPDFAMLYQKTGDISKMIYGLINYLKSSEHKGYKFKNQSSQLRTSPPAGALGQGTSNFEPRTSNIISINP